MKTTKLNNPVTLVVVGMPGSGTTIIASFINSLERSIIFGEPTRAGSNVTFKSRYEDYRFKPGDKLEQIIDFGNRHDLLIRGYKEVWNVRHFHLIELVEGQRDKLDIVLTVLREPRRNYSSMMAMNHNRGTKGSTKQYIIYMYTSLADKILNDPLYVPIIYDEFIKDPFGTINTKLCWGVVGQMSLGNYVGGGHNSAMRSHEVKPVNSRPPSKEKGLDKMIDAYNQVLKAQQTMDCPEY